MITGIQQSFNGGQMAPMLRNRADLDKYRSGMRQGDNYIPTPFGPLRRRPGFIYSHNARSNANKSRVITFSLGSSDGYVLELGNGYIRFTRNRSVVTDAGTAWADATTYVAGVVVSNGGSYYLCLETHVSDDGGTGGSDDGPGDTEPGVGTDAGDFWHLLTTSGAAGIYEWPTPYASADLFDIQVAQVNDVLYLVHKGYPIKTLLRVAEDHFVFADIDWTWPPMREPNLDESHTMTASALTGTITLTSSEDFFTSSMVGGQIQIGHLRGETEYEVRTVLGAGAVAGGSIIIRGEYQVRTTGVSASTIQVQESEDGSSWATVRTITTTASENKVFTRTTGNGSGQLRYVRANVTASGSGSGTPEVIIEAIDPEVYGWVTITGYTNATTVTASVESRLYSTGATEIWSEGAFSDRRGHARTVTLHELRLVFGGSDTDRQTAWGSQTDDFPNFETGTLDTDSWRYQIASTDLNEINWLVSQKQLLIGTSGGEWVMDSGRDEQVITPTNVRARRHSNYGSEYRQALTVDSATLFVRSGGERLADFSYFFEDDGYNSADLNLLSYDLTRGGIVQLAYQKKRDPFIWAAIDGRNLAVVSYNRKQDVTGWCPIFSLGGSGSDEIESVTVVGREGDEDEVWCVIKRTINGGVVRYIERLDSDSFDKQQDAAHFNHAEGLVADTGTNLADLVMVDSAYVATGGDLSVSSGDTTVSGLDHLVGEDVIAYADGSREGDTHAVNGSGEITLEGIEPDQVVVGLPYKSTFRSLPLFNAFETGTTRGHEVKLHKAVIIVHRSGSFMVKDYDDPNGLTEIGVRSTDIDEGDPTPLRDDEFEVTLSGRHGYDPSIVIETEEPTPLTILALVLKYSVHGE